MMADWRIDPKLTSPTGGVDVGSDVHFPGWNGLPFRGRPDLFRETDPQSQQPKEAYKTHTDIFDMTDEEQKKKYNEMLQMVYNGFAIIHKEESRYNKDTKNWKIFVAWCELFTYNPKEHPTR
jgi:hypothetical protein